MKIIGNKFLAAFAAAMLSAGAADAASVVIGADNSSVAYVRNADVGVVRPMTKRLKSQAIKDGNAYIPKGTRFLITNAEPLDAAVLKKGDCVTFVLPEDFKVNEKTVITKGKELTGTVTKVKHRAAFSSKSSFSVNVKEIETDSGIPVALKCVVEENFKGKTYLPEGSEFFATTVADTDLNFSVADTAKKHSPRKKQTRQSDIF